MASQIYLMFRCLLLSLSIAFWAFRTAMLVLFIIILTTQDLPQDNATFILTAIYGSQVAWAFLLSAFFFVCWKKGTLFVSRLLVKIAMIVWLAAAIPTYFSQICLGNDYVKVFWAAQTLVSMGYLFWVIIEFFVPEKTAANEYAMDPKLKQACEAQAQVLM